jgi:hypothetical protein
MERGDAVVLPCASVPGGRPGYAVDVAQGVHQLAEDPADPFEIAADALGECRVRMHDPPVHLVKGIFTRRVVFCGVLLLLRLCCVSVDTVSPAGAVMIVTLHRPSRAALDDMLRECRQGP